MVSTPKRKIEKDCNKIFVQTKLGFVDNTSKHGDISNNFELSLKRFHRFLQENHYSKSTIESYGKTIKKMFYNKTLTQLTQQDLNNIRLNLVETYQHNGNRIRFAAINLFCKEILKRNDIYLSIPKSKIKNKDILTNQQIEKILRVAQTKRKGIYAIMQTLYDCALRKNELCNLNLDDVNFETLELSLRNTKTGDEIVMMTTRVAQALQSYIQDERQTENMYENAVFLNRYGRRVGEHFVRNHFKECAREAGILSRVYPHILRVSCITHLLNKGVNPLTVQRHARHRDFRTTMIYNRPTQQQMKADIERVFHSEVCGSIKPKQLKPENEFIGYA